MKLGDIVLFDKYYRKRHGYVTYENLTDEQKIEFEETDVVVLPRLDEIELKNTQEGIVVGKRKLVKNTTFGLGTYQYNPDGEDSWLIVEVETVDVYLIATTMSGFHRVPAEWLQIS